MTTSRIVTCFEQITRAYARIIDGLGALDRDEIVPALIQQP